MSDQKRRRERTRTIVTLGWMTLLFIHTSLAFAIATPLFQNPDEPTHIDLARHYAHHPTEMAGPSLRQTQGSRGAISATGLRDEALPPDFSRVPADRPDYRSFAQYGGGDSPATSGCPVSCQNYQYGHPPGWYLLLAPLAWVTDREAFPDVVLAFRVVDILIASVVVVCTWYLARQVWPSRPRRALLAAAVTASFGPVAATAAAANNDALMLALMAIALAVMARVLRQGAESKVVLLLGALIAAGLLTKGEFLPIAPVGLAAVLVAPQRTARWKSALLYLVPAGIGGLWWLRVLLDTHSFTPRGSEIVKGSQPGPWQSVGYLRYLFDRLPEFFDRFSGVYGWLSVELPRNGQLIFQIGVVVLIAGWLLCREWRRPRNSELRFIVLAIAPLMLLLSAAFAAYSTFHRNGDIRGMAPRYVYGSIPVLATGVIAAVSAIAARMRAGRVFIVGVVVAAVSAVGTAGSFIYAMRGQYATTSFQLMIDRADVVAPLPHPLRWLVCIALAWGACVVAIALLVSQQWRPALKHARGRSAH